MTATVPATGPIRTSGRAGPAPSRRIPRLRTVLAAVAVAVVAVELVVAAPSIVQSVEALAGARLWWIVVAVALEALSFLGFALAKRALFLGTGHRVSRRAVLTGILVSNAVHATAPAGIAVSTAYNFRWARTRRVPAAAAAWQLAAGGVLSAVTLTALAATGALLLGTGVSVTSLLLAAAPLALLTLASRWVTVHGDTAVASLAALLRRVRIGPLRRPGLALADGVDALRRGAADLAVIRPRTGTWLAAAAYALSNWVLDLAALTVCLVATGVPVPAAGGLLLAYTAGMAASSFSLLPFGIGTTDLALLAGLVAAGCGAQAALPAVVLYRLIAMGLPTLVGWVLGARELHRHPAEDPSPA